MFKNYFKVAFRNVLRNKSTSIINIGGLAIGLAVAMLIGLWIWDELSFNKQHDNYPRIAQVMKYATYKDGPDVGKSLPYPLTVELKEKYKQHFKHAITARPQEAFDLGAGQQLITAIGQFIDADAPEMLSLQMISGNLDALQELHSMIIAQSTAKALFGNTDPLQQTVRINNNTEVTITGVYEDLPLNSEFNKVKFFAPFSLDMAINPWIKNQSWDNSFLNLYVEINDNTDCEKISAIIKDAEISITRNLENYQKQAQREPKIFLNPMSKWHLYSEFKNGIREGGPIKFVKLIGIIGTFVLLLACINFMNLSTARAEKRAKEVGVRKTMGSARSQLIWQFFTESFLVVAFAFILAIVVATLLLPGFNNLSSKEISMPWTNIWFWIVSFVFVILTSVLSGSYPALYLSSFRPVRVLKGSFKAGRFAALPRKVLVVVQFSVSIALIICTTVVYRQLSFAKDRPIGYDREGVLMIEKKSADFYGKLDVLTNELQKTGAISMVAESGGQITNVWQGNGGFTWRGKDASFDPNFATLGVSHDYGTTMGWQFVAGRDFAKDKYDSTSIIITESAARLMGINNPVGEFVRWETNWMKAKTYQVIGVIKDLVMDSPFEPIVPTIFRVENSLPWMNLKINPKVSSATAIAAVERVFKKIIPTAPFNFKFVDTEYAAKFAAEDRIARLSTLFSILAIFISCLGLFGLASFVAEQRTKELGVRKVLGATVLNLWKLLSKDFVLLVVVSFFVAAPVSYYFMNRWLENYHYRADISLWIFAGAGLAALLITIATISFQTIKAAVVNPVRSLRSE